MKHLTLLTGLALAGCASVSDIQAGDVAAEQSVAKPIGDMVTCLMAATKPLSSGPVMGANGVQTIEVRDGWGKPISLYELTDQGATTLLRVKHAGGGRSSTYWKKCI